MHSSAPDCETIWRNEFTEYMTKLSNTNALFNPFKPSGAKWLHYKVFKAILV